MNKRTRVTRAAQRRELTIWVVARPVVLTLAVIVVLCVAWVTVRGLMAKGELATSVALASSIRSQIAGDDAAAAQVTAHELAKHVNRARDLTTDPIWRAAEMMPIAGPNLTAVRQASAVASVVAEDAVVPLVRVFGSVTMSDFKPVDGAVDLKPLVAAQPVVSAATDALETGLTDARAIDTSGTIGQIGDPVGKLVRVLAQARDQAKAVDQTVGRLPAMMGGSGPRTYLLLFQNNAELRSSGGIPGAVALVHAEAGRLSLVSQATASSFPRFAQPVLPLPVETEGIYGSITGQYLQDVTLTPRFPLAARLAREMWKREHGTSVDGVLSVDPVALGYILSATGPIRLQTGDTLTSDNAVKLLLSDVYARYNGSAHQDEFFASAAGAVFAKVAQGDFDPKKMIAALAKSADERRILLWSAALDEQKQIKATTLGGDLPANTPASPTFGVYLNDATGAKMGYYLGVTVGVGQASCRKDGRPTWAVDVTLTNNAAADAGAMLPEYVTGGGQFGVDPGHIRTTVAVYAPPSSLFTGATIDGTDASLRTAVDSGHVVALFTAELAPGQSTVVRTTFLGASRSTGHPSVIMTPAIDRHEPQRIDVTCSTPAR